MNASTLDPRPYMQVDGLGTFIPWNADFNMEFSFEIDLGQVEPLLPAGLTAVETVPGRALCNVGYLRFPPGTPVAGPIQELSLAVHVYPDLSMHPVPRFAFYVLNVASDSERFLDWAHEVDHMEVYRSPELRFHAEPERWRVTVSDAHGPICTLANSHPRPRFKAGHAHFHIFTNKGDPCRTQRGHWIGSRCEHQRPSSASVLHPHPFFRGMDVSSARSYLQIITTPGELVEQRFYYHDQDE